MKKFLFAVMLALPLSWSIAAFAEDAPAPAGGDAEKKADDGAKKEKKGKGKKKKEKKEEAPKTE
jgi:hypothetical protein